MAVETFACEGTGSDVNGEDLGLFVFDKKLIPVYLRMCRGEGRRGGGGGGRDTMVVEDLSGWFRADIVTVKLKEVCVSVPTEL